MHAHTLHIKSYLKKKLVTLKGKKRKKRKIFKKGEKEKGKKGREKEKGRKERKKGRERK